MIIVEIGNNHEGDIFTATKMIESACNCGAQIIKFQAGTAKGFARTAEDIPKYEKYTFSVAQFFALKRIAHDKGLKVCFSIWGDCYECLRKIEDYHKIPARQCTKKLITQLDTDKTFVSIPYNRDKKEYKNLLIRLKDIMQNAIPMYCISEYPVINPELENLDLMRSIFNDRSIDYSDHTIGIGACKEAISKYKVEFIEKHFTLDKKTKGLRDHILSANPKELKELIIHEKYETTIPLPKVQ